MANFVIDITPTCVAYLFLCGLIHIGSSLSKCNLNSMTNSEIRNMMSHLPEHVSDAEIEEMFSFADKNNDGRISWEEFMVIFLAILNNS